jgi:hypothetical protein
MAMSRIFLACFLVIAVFPLLTGCSSMAKGVAEAMMERDDQKDERMCDIEGAAFPGVQESLDAQPPEAHHTKVLMVHGIGKHLPDYSIRFRQKLAAELGLDGVDGTVHVIDLVNQTEKPQTSVGLLKIYRLFSTTTSRDLIFYELTWSSITDKNKEVIAFDDSEAYTWRRAGLNKTLKGFMNATVPDVLAYEGEKRPLINKAVGQSVCWMFRHEWGDLPVKGSGFCDVHTAGIAANIARDDYFVVTHSLGSRIAIDTFNYAAGLKRDCGDCKNLKQLQNETITIFMLANQLPFLQVGHEPPDVTEAEGQYCKPSGAKYDSRLINKTRIIAFSDPNDILSYPVPPDYAAHYIDSRVCPEITNVDINVAHVADVFGMTEFANPLEAHSGYFDDDRVVKIIADGLDRKQMDPMIAQRCKWTEVKY